MNLVVDLFTKLYSIFNKNKFIQALKQSSTMMLPILLIGSIALLLQSFPIDFIRENITTCFNGTVNTILSLIYTITFGFSSLYLLIILTSKYFDVISKRNNIKIYACINSLICYIILIGHKIFDNSTLIIEYTNMNNMFVALITSLLATLFFHWCTEYIASKRKKISFTSNFNTALNIIIPMALTIIIFLIISVIIHFLSGYNLNDFISSIISLPFETIGNTYIGGLLINIVSLILFFFGIHGRSVFEDVYAEVFATSSGSIASNALFDCFTLIGGVGSTLCLVIAIIMFSDGRRRKKVAKASMFPMIFNINEIMIFGLPIIFNPVYIIPFVLVPIVNYSIGYLCVYFDIIPLIEANFQWTTPVLLNGYLGTNSIICVLIQLLCLVIGVAIYTPFVILDNKVLINSASEINTDIKNYIIDCENKMIEPKIFGLNNYICMHAESILVNLENSIRNNDIELHYQPQIKDNKIVSVEALLRYKYKCIEYLFPPIVILICKEKDLFKDLSKEIVKRAILDYKQMLILNSDMKISVNLDLDILHDIEFFNWLVEYVDLQNLPKYQFGIEVTENSKYSVNSNLNKMFDVLHQHGINIYMDDFSMGNTSIRFLQDTYFDYVKLDGSLVKNIDNERAKNIVESIINLGQNLGFEVIAEYVETKEQKEKLKKLGCNTYQGYLYYKALPLSELLKEINK